MKRTKYMAAAMLVGFCIGCSDNKVSESSTTTAAEKDKAAAQAAMLKKVCESVPNHMGPPIEC